MAYIELDANGRFIRGDIPLPSNFHVHLRWAELMQAVTASILRNKQYVVAMPNNGATGILRTVGESIDYWYVLKPIAEKAGARTRVLMTIYNNKGITAAVIELIAHSSVVRAIKCYPGEAGATTGSGHGIPLEETENDVLKAAVDNNVRYLVHGEVVRDKNGTVLEPSQRERYYMREILPRVRDRHPNLLICAEHLTTTEGVDFVMGDPSGNTVATVTPWHLIFTKKDFSRTWGNHLKCMPILKEEEDRQALLKFVGSRNKRAIAGTDTAPHPSELKEGELEKVANGTFTDQVVEMYGHGFHREKLFADGGDAFVHFLSFNGPDWWGLPRPTSNETITLLPGRSTDSLHPTPILKTEGGVTKMVDRVVPVGWDKDGNHYDFGFVTQRGIGF